MRTIFLLLIILPALAQAQPSSTSEQKSWAAQARRVTIIRDEWGVPHIYGKSDADAVFGLMYAQYEDNRWQVEETAIRNLGRSAEIYGEKYLDMQSEPVIQEKKNK